ncbi:MAG: XrtB/PEP-CTERM-associated polysaccharide biosynthesis outer membrane protein EpsL [Methylophilaceae bacterium]
MLLAFVMFGANTRFAFADEGDFFRPYVGLTQGYDSNLRRFNKKDSALAATGSKETSDTFLIKKVGIILDKEISLQKFYVDISGDQTSYNRNSGLDNDGKKAIARWNWHIGSHLEGNLERYHKEAMVPFADFRGLGLNVQTEDRKSFDTIWRFHPSWQMRGAISEYESQYSSVSQRTANLDETAQELGIDYLSPSSSTIGLQLRHARGDRPEQQRVGLLLIDNSYDQNELKAKVDWVYSGKTRLQFLGGEVERKHDEFSERDFKGFNARLNTLWQATGKTSFNLSTWREINGQSYVTSSYTLSKGSSIGASWDATSKVSLQSNIRYETVDFEGDSINSTRTDKNRYYSLALVYKPILGLVLNASVNRSLRDSTIPSLGYVSNGAILSAQYEF